MNFYLFAQTPTYSDFLKLASRLHALEESFNYMLVTVVAVSLAVGYSVGLWYGSRQRVEQEKKKFKF